MKRIKLLLDDRFAPITSCVGFFDAALVTVGGALREWRESLGVNVGVRPVAEPFPEILRRLEPLTLAVRPRELLLATRSPWTAYFDSGAHGPDPFGPVGYLCGVLKCRGLMVTCVPDTLIGKVKGAKGRHGGVQFQLFSPERTEFLNILRSVSVIKDGGRWEFDSAGQVQPFERPDRYSARRVRERFTSEMLEEYCAALGVRYFDPAFYGPEGMLFEVRGRLEDGASITSMTLSEAQERLGIAPQASPSPTNQ